MVRTCTVSYRRAVCAQPHTSSRVEGREVFYFANVYNRLSRKRRYICRSSIYLLTIPPLITYYLLLLTSSLTPPIIFPSGALLVGFAPTTLRCHSQPPLCKLSSLGRPQERKASSGSSPTTCFVTARW